MVRSERVVDGVAWSEKSYYICSRVMSAKSFASAAQGHRRIENSLHWVLDVAFREDDCRVRKDHAPENLSLVHRIGLNLLREERQVCKLGLKGKRHRCAIDDSYLEAVLGF